eukprot:CAMPEP_0174711884 /NCGR_PEP_ID=MMETSP1094-20130205/13069_1 /TAXON_ID=156173 /ORGANISM="Chrysochromulina brevifilum, Strain UTEX LB 985" /LENGTH=100 /DNA_ID=CAMNT_0015910887 /DNA_START=681 /DNA_END=979 /DNA_ORIENTATION=-
MESGRPPWSSLVRFGSDERRRGTDDGEESLFELDITPSEARSTLPPCALAEERRIRVPLLLERTLSSGAGAAHAPDMRRRVFSPMVVLVAASLFGLCKPP